MNNIISVIDDADPPSVLQNSLTSSLFYYVAGKYFAHPATNNKQFCHNLYIFACISSSFSLVAMTNLVSACSLTAIRRYYGLRLTASRLSKASGAPKRSESSQHMIPTLVTICSPFSSSANESEGGNQSNKASTHQSYLHISPSGDYWVGTSIFAAVRILNESISLGHQLLCYLFSSIKLNILYSCVHTSRLRHQKHLQPDYVKSIPIPDDFNPDEYLEGVKEEVLHRIYDEGRLPSSFFKK